MTFISEGSIMGPMTPDPGGDPEEMRLQPFVSIGGIDQFSPECSQLQSPSTLEGGAVSTPIKRYSIAVAPLQVGTGGSDLGYPNDGGNKWLINLDSEQLYTAPRNSLTAAGFNFGKKWSPPGTAGSNCYEKYGEADGAYDIPVPVQGAPIEFRKIYFKGQSVDANGATVPGVAGSGCNSYFAYFACSLPIKQDCNISGTVYNPRNENFGIMDGEVDAWENFDISCAGSGGSGCSNVYSKVSITGSQNTGFTPSGCDGNVIFATSGCMTGNGSFSHDIRQEGNDTIVTYSVNPNFVSSVSGVSSTASVSGCDRSINFETDGCTGNALTVAVNELSDGNVSVVHSLNTAELIYCLGYEEMSIDICEGGSVVSRTFLVKIT